MCAAPASRLRRFALLLGAGASYGAWRDSQSPTPPLGDGLFERLAGAFPNTWGSLSEAQVAAFSDDDPGLGFETGMARLWRDDLQGAQRAQPLLTDMAIYFAKFRLPVDQPNCYTQLLSGLARIGLIGERLAVATLNYECLLDLAAAELRIFPNPYPVPPCRGALTAWKPHGACNLVVKPVADGAWVNITIGQCQAYLVGAGIPLVPVHPDQVISLYENQVNIPPAMSMYAPGKESPVAPEYIDQSRALWLEWSRNAAVAVVVGARPNFDDAHVWSGITDGASDVWFVGDDESAAKLRAAIGEGRVTHLGSRFHEVLPSLCTRLSLSV